MQDGGGGGGAGDRGGGGARRIGGGRWKRKGRKVRDLKGLKEGGIGGKYATMLNIS